MVKDQLTTEDIEKMWNADPLDQNEALARDTFLFSYYSSGARFRDVLVMPKSAIYMDGAKQRIRWTPSKTKNSTGEVLDMEINKRMAAIIKRNSNDTDTIFGVINLKLAPEDLEKNIDSTQSKISKSLKLFIARCGISKSISFHDARRTLSKHLKYAGGDLHGIKDVMGHGDIKTTQGYVGRDQEAKDRLLKKLYKK